MIGWCRRRKSGSTSRVRQPPTPKTTTPNLTIYSMSRGGKIWQGLILLFFFPRPWGLLFGGLCFVVFHYVGLGLGHFFGSRDDELAAASSDGIVTNNGLDELDGLDWFGFGLLLLLMLSKGLKVY
ncbi:hypothetical protein C2G38_383331 [Gigaspora rosea]|uniref:Uncharacterized protein n=1 Tax=Gigaspora rosea TaxID=44941 RepID=A0A397VVE0_9GLOM|nr:hypothetical protein C2G38_383331 [Gigaspora rosea]